QENDVWPSRLRSPPRARSRINLTASHSLRENQFPPGIDTLGMSRPTFNERGQHSARKGGQHSKRFDTHHRLHGRYRWHRGAGNTGLNVPEYLYAADQ
ncbi:hypothetical protein, partial [Aureimonas pseudogalii]|uniref:hypothetical protein n=1 Tax=Aureimonas pseudogalii TaxID=1744844 RepID=UPI001AED38E2